MKVFMINPNNERVEVDVLRYFQNMNDKYVVYSLGEKDANGLQVVYAIKIGNDGGVRVGQNITDNNEWELVKRFIRETVSQNKNNQPLTIQDVNPAEIAELKIDSMHPFKLQVPVVEMFEKNQKSFDIVQTEAPVENHVEENPTSLDIPTPVEPVVPSVETPVMPTEVPETTPAVEPVPSVEPIEPTQPVAPVEPTVEPTLEPPVTNPTFSDTPVVEPIPTEVPTPEAIAPVSPVENVEGAEQPLEDGGMKDYQALYEAEVAKNKDLTNELENVMNDYATLKTKMEQIKELLG